jgi:hypothetical protein
VELLRQIATARAKESLSFMLKFNYCKRKNEEQVDWDSSTHIYNGEAPDI